MARIRTIKPEFWANERLSALPVGTHLLAAALLNYADDRGFFNANPSLVRAACFPLRDYSADSVEEMLGSLEGIGYIELREASDGKRIGWITKFVEHQRISHPKPSKIEELWSNGVIPEKSRKSHEKFRQDQGSGIRDQGMDQGTGNGADAPAPQRGAKARLIAAPLSPDAEIVRGEVMKLTGVNYPPSSWKGLEGRLAAGEVTVPQAISLMRSLAQDQFWGTQVKLDPSTIFRPKHFPGLMARSQPPVTEVAPSGKKYANLASEANSWDGYGTMEAYLEAIETYNRDHPEDPYEPRVVT